MATKRIGEILLENGIITQEHLDEALKVQRTKGGLLGIILVRLGYLNPKVLAEFIDHQKYS